jgi:hypothetical protein
MSRILIFFAGIPQPDDHFHSIPSNLSHFTRKSSAKKESSTCCGADVFYTGYISFPQGSV